jgi:hypothetical protein
MRIQPRAILSIGIRARAKQRLRLIDVASGNGTKQIAAGGSLRRNGPDSAQ